MPYKSNEERTAWAVVYCLHVFLYMPWAAAYAAGRGDAHLGKFLLAEEMSRSDQQEARRCGKKLIQNATVANLPHDKKLNTHKLLSAIPGDEAKLASCLLKTGYVERTPNGHGRFNEEHHYFTSLTSALEQCPPLRGIYEKYSAMCDKVTPELFMAALYKWDPLLRERRIHIKYALDEELKEQRQTKADYFFKQAKNNPEWLKRIFFVDECGINFDHEIRKGVTVYCDAHDKGYRFVIPFQKLQANRAIKVKVMGAVNMLTGPVFLEFTTGTTDVQRMHNVSDDGTQRNYRVSVCVTTCIE